MVEPASAAAVLEFWFGEPPAAVARPEWFRKDEAFDALVRERFGATIEAGLDGRLDVWAADPVAAPRAALARLVVLDQFTRNAFRGQARAFAGDERALAGAEAMVAAGSDRALAPLERWFAYLPFEHAESLAQQRRAVTLFGALAAEHPALADAHVWALRHLEVIERFGRFPHRNAVLGRESTAAERAYLAEPGAGF